MSGSEEGLTKMQSDRLGAVEQEQRLSPNAIDPRVCAPFRLYFWANENSETHKGPHVHVESGDGYAEFWLDPVSVKDAGSYNADQRARARRMVEKHEAECLAAWEVFDGRR